MTMSSPAGQVAEDREAAQVRVLRTLVAAQVLSGAGLAAGLTVGALLARDMLGSNSYAGIPAALLTTGSAGAAALVGRISNARGRRRGLGLGYMAGALGAVLVVLAADLGSIALLFPALLVYGAGTATNLQARYAAADLAAPEQRGRAVSTVLLATTFGAVAGPNAVSVMGDLAESLGLPRLSGPFLLGAAAYGLAGAVLLLWLRPDPLMLARSLAQRPSETSAVVDANPSTPLATRSLVLVGGMILVVAQLVMVAIMTMTPVHMRNHGHSLAAAGAVIAAHIAGMYLPSPITGRLVDRFGPRVVAALAGATLALSGLLAAAAPTDSPVGLAVALVLLGVGWNLGLLSGTAILADAAPLAIRARVQGSVDLGVALAAAGGGVGSGVVMGATSYPVLSMLGAVVGVAVVPVVAIKGPPARRARRLAVGTMVRDPAGARRTPAAACRSRTGGWGCR